MDAEYSRKSGQIPSFGDWEIANEMPITQYFACARQAGLLRCSCSGECGAFFMNNADAWGGGGGGCAAGGGGDDDLYGVGFEKPPPRRVYAVPQRKTSGINKEFSHSKDQRKQFKVGNSTDRPRRNRCSTQDPYPKQSKKSVNLVLHVPPVAVKPLDEDLYKISPELIKKSKRRNMLGFFSRCMVPPCAV